MSMPTKLGPPLFGFPSPCFGLECGGEDHWFQRRVVDVRTISGDT